MDGWVDLVAVRALSSWTISLGVLGLALALFLYLSGLRIIGNTVELELAIEWLPRWTTLTKLERWSILWGYAHMDEDEQEIFRELWYQMDCRMFTEFGWIQSALLASRAGSFAITEMARSIKHPEWIMGLQHPSRMVVTERPTTLYQIIASDFSGLAARISLVTITLGIAMRVVTH